MTRLKIAFVLGIALSRISAENPVYDAALGRLESNPNAEKVLELGGHLRGVARYSQLPESDPYYIKIQRALLAIPGHAKYFAEKLESERAALGPVNGVMRDPRSNDMQRFWTIVETLPHLPSPETVGVLGRYLSDESDEVDEMSLAGQDYTVVESNAILAVRAFHEIGLRDPPIGRDKLGLEGRCLPSYRAWWEEVKSGKRAFSFKGQSVEYRFKPDGTWETQALARPPDDGPGRPEAGVKRPERRPAGKTPAPAQTGTASRWPWVAVPALLLLAVLGWRFLRKKHR